MSETNAEVTGQHNEDLDRADRGDRWRLAAVLLAVLLVGAIAWLTFAGNRAAQDKAVSEASQKFTLAQQVAAACAIKEQADDLGGLCAKAQQLVKEGPAGSMGLQGPPGTTGAQGPLGPKGEVGASGLQGIQGAQGLLGKSGAQGLLGEPGAAGDKGAVGADGVTGTPGPAGAVGQPGPAGATGAVGPPGANGQTPTTMTCVEAAAPARGTFDCTVTAWR